MLRIYFTADDIARTRLATAPDPLWELVLSVQMLRGQRGDLLFSTWRRETAAALRDRRPGPDIKLLMQLCPEIGYFPDFLNPAEAMRGLDHGLEAIRRTPEAILRRDMTYLAESRKRQRAGELTATANELATGSAEAVRTLTRTMRGYYDVAISPHTRAIEKAIGQDRQLRLSAFTEGGVEGLLASMRPMLRWKAGELQVPQHRNQEIHLGGRGLTLIPSYFCVNQPMTMFDPGLPPVLIYPVPRTPDTLSIMDGRPRAALASLIGQTRAAMLESIGNGGTTTELARRAGVSPASASEHAAIMRSADLIRSRRDGNRMIHELTDLGLALLNGG
jgi:DNA-binding transcriptional ArsR family regulator